MSNILLLFLLLLSSISFSSSPPVPSSSSPPVPSFPVPSFCHPPPPVTFPLLYVPSICLCHVVSIPSTWHITNVLTNSNFVFLIILYVLSMLNYLSRLLFELQCSIQLCVILVQYLNFWILTNSDEGQMFLLKYKKLFEPWWLILQNKMHELCSTHGRDEKLIEQSGSENMTGGNVSGYGDAGEIY